MASAQYPNHTFMLTPQQRTLLFAALNNHSANSQSSPGANTMSPATANQSPTLFDGLSQPQETPYLDYSYDFGVPDSSFDYSDVSGKMIGDLPGAPQTSKSDSPSNESPNDKRSHPDDDDDEESGGDAKRREGEENKAPKKPGRKPLTTEPSTKRKAQNRAAQRAFRERKEKHLKDLETKVQELQTASDTANNENEQLRAEITKMKDELAEYKKRISFLSTNPGNVSTQQPMGMGLNRFGAPLLDTFSDVNFHFDFPKFGSLPGPSAIDNQSPSTMSPLSAPAPAKRDSNGQLSPSGTPRDGVSPADSSTYRQAGPDKKAKEDLGKATSGIYTPALTSTNLTKASRTSMDSYPSLSGPNSTASPTSSHSNCGPSSSCGTSPEPFTQSPMGFKPIDTLTTIGEEQQDQHNASDFGHFSNVDVNSFNNWLPQNNFPFEPQLFGDYREPQENILGGFDDSLFNDALDMDFTMPYNLHPVLGSEAPKKDLIAQIDAAKESDDPTVLLTYQKIWEELQTCPKVKSGDFDLDGLCSDLQKKAKCSGSGPVVDETDFKTVIKKYIGKDGEECTSTKIASYAK